MLYVTVHTALQHTETQVNCNNSCCNSLFTGAAMLLRAQSSGTQISGPVG